MRTERIRKNDLLPLSIENEINRRKKEEFYESFMHGNNLYLVASLGQKNTAGYEVSFEDIKATDSEEIEVMMQRKEPQKGCVQAQVITTPFTILKIWLDKDRTPKRVIFKNHHGEVIKGTEVNTVYSNS